jgi:hypothetical protein
VLVEFALVIPFFAIMLFGMIQFGIAFAGWAAVRNVVQNGARLAAIGDFGAYSGNPSCSALTQAESDTGQPPPNGNTAEMYCQIVSQIGSPIGSAVSSTNFPHVGILVTNNVANNSVTVCGVVPAQPLTGLFPGLNLSSTSGFLIEDAVNLETYNPYGISNC